MPFPKETHEWIVQCSTAFRFQTHKMSKNPNPITDDDTGGPQLHTIKGADQSMNDRANLNPHSWAG